MKKRERLIMAELTALEHCIVSKTHWKGTWLLECKQIPGKTTNAALENI